MTLGPDRVAFFLCHHREELTRIWRVARAAARPDLFPGLIDGVVPSFFEAGGALLIRGGIPGEVWSALTGVVRWPPPLAAAEVKTEWTLLGEVVGAACESIGAGPEVTGWLRDAVSACRDATAHGLASPPNGVLFTIMYSPLLPRTVPAQHEPDA